MMLLDYFGVFGCIFGKMDEISKIWAVSRVIRRGVGIPCNSVGPRRGVAERGLGEASGMPRRGVAERGLRQASGTPQRSSAKLR